MFLESDNFDDLLKSAFEKVHDEGRPCRATRGPFVELTGMSLKLHNPRSRLSRSEAKGRPFSCIGEFAWYLSGQNDLQTIEYYIPDYIKDVEQDGTLYGGYGPRLFPLGPHSQIDQIVEALTIKDTSRRAVIQLFSANDIAVGTNFKEIPCTLTIQFLIREKRLECMVSMRSNDVFKGFPHDVFCFTMLQEMIARKLGVDLGTYHHFAGSFHLYEKDVKKSFDYINEGFQSDISMPAMPEGDPFPDMPLFLKKLKAIRDGAGLATIDTALDEYWNDLLRMMIAYHHSCDHVIIDKVESQLVNRAYFPFVERRRTVSRPKPKARNASQVS